MQAERIAAPAGAREIARPRVGLYRPFMASMDEGWTRWMLERYGFEVVNLSPKISVAAGRWPTHRLLVIADEARGLMEGYTTGMVPPQFEGGIGEDGARAIDSFVKDGGTLVCFNRATAFAIQQFGAAGEERGRGHEAPGVLHGRLGAEVEAATSHPVMAGMPARAAIFVDGSPAFETGEGFKGEVLAKYQSTGSPLLSGYLLGEQFLNNRAAALDVAYGKGHIVLLGFRPQWRGQPFGTFRVVFNAVLGRGPKTAAWGLGLAGLGS